MRLEPTHEQHAFQQQVIEFAASDASRRRRRDRRERARSRASVIAAAAKLGLMGVTIPDERGGGGRDYVSYALAHRGAGARRARWSR